jgi:plasmid stabilization system protein ParE
MKNISKVIWSQRAKTDLNSILNYFEENWTEKEIGKFFRKLDKQISIIQNQPKALPTTQKNNVRRFVLTSQTTIYYDILKDSVRIVALFDTRQSPKKLNL